MKQKIGLGARIMSLLILATVLFMINSLAAQPMNGATTSKKLLYEDNFSTSKNSLFSSYNSEEEKYYFNNGKYSIIVLPIYWASFSFLDNHRVSNPTLQVEARQVSGPDDNGYGIIFAYKDDGNYYYFLISGDGYYQIAKIKDNSSSYWIDRSWITEAQAYRINNVWSPKYWTPSDKIHTGNATNLINVTSKGDEILFYVNNKTIDEIPVENASGIMGLRVETEGTPGIVKIDFDNLKLWGNSWQEIKMSNDDYAD